jgi:hypothetical protein
LKKGAALKVSFTKPEQYIILWQLEGGYILQGFMIEVLQTAAFLNLNPAILFNFSETAQQNWPDWVFVNSARTV